MQLCWLVILRDEGAALARVQARRGCLTTCTLIGRRAKGTLAQKGYTDAALVTSDASRPLAPARRTRL